MRTDLRVNEVDTDLTFLFHEKKEDCDKCIYWLEPFKESNDDLPCCCLFSEKSKAYQLGYESKCSEKISRRGKI